MKGELRSFRSMIALQRMSFTVSDEFITRLG